MDRIDKKGYWWLPSNPNHRVAGTLVFGDSTNSELELLGALRDDFEAFKAMGNWGEEHRPEIILGLCSEGVEYTLCNCLQYGGTFNTSSFLVETFHPTVVIEGKHFDSLNDIIFHHMTMRLSHLGDWYQRTGRSVTFEEIEKEKRKTTMTYQKAEELIVPFSGGTVEFGHDSRIKFARFSGDFSISEEACVSVYPDTPLPMSEFLHESLPPITHFISLGVGRSLTMKELRAKAAVDCMGATAEETRRAPSLRLYWKKPPSEDADKELSSHNMVATCPDFGASLPAFLDAWVNMYRQMKPVMELFFGWVLPRDGISSNSFLNAAQAAEAYHRYRKEGRVLSELNHCERMSSILDSAPAEHREWLEKRLEYSNEKSFRRRIKELLRERQDLFGLASSDIKGLSERATVLRNHFTHYTGGNETTFGTGEEFYRFECLFKWTIIACLLEEMGFPRERAHELIKGNQDFLFFVSAYLKPLGQV